MQSESRGLTRELKTLKITWGLWLLLATRSEKKIVLADFTAPWYLHNVSCIISNESFSQLLCRHIWESGYCHSTRVLKQLLGVFFFNRATESNIQIQVQSNKTVNSSTPRLQSSRLYNTESLKSLENCEVVNGLIAHTLRAEAHVDVSKLGVNKTGGWYEIHVTYNPNSGNVGTFF